MASLGLREHLAEITELVIDFSRLDHRPAHFLPQNRAVARAQARYIAPQSDRATMQSMRDFLIRNGFIATARQIRAQTIEEGSFARDVAFLREPIEGLPDKRDCPFAIEKSARAPIPSGSQLRLYFGNSAFVEKLANFSTATFLRLLAVSRIRY